MANIFHSGQQVTITDGINPSVMLIDDSHVKHFVDVPDGSAGVVQAAVLGGSIYLIRTRGVKADGSSVLGTGMFAESSLG